MVNVRIRYDENQKVLWLDRGEQGISALGYTKADLVTDISAINIHYDDKLLSTIGIVITDTEYSSLYSLWFDNKYTKFRGLHWDSKELSAKKDIATTISQAIISGDPLCIIFEDGYCSYPSEEDEDNAMVSQDGLTHIIKVGQTTGEKKFPLALASKYADGGGILDLFGIKEVILLKGL